MVNYTLRDTWIGSWVLKFFFEYTKIATEKHARYIACKLRSGALAWWTQLTQTRRQQGKCTIQSWREMKQQLRNQFLPFDYEQQLYVQYQHYYQGTCSVNAYTEDFYRLSARNCLRE